MQDDSENWLRIALAGDDVRSFDDGSENWLRIAIESHGVAAAQAIVENEAAVPIDTALAGNNVTARTDPV